MSVTGQIDEQHVKWQSDELLRRAEENRELQEVIKEKNKEIESLKADLRAIQAVVNKRDLSPAKEEKGRNWKQGE